MIESIYGSISLSWSYGSRQASSCWAFGVYWLGQSCTSFQDMSVAELGH